MNTSDYALRPASQRASALTVESAAYLAVFGLALALRLYGLGAHPLTDPEAREALTVLRFLRGASEAGLPAEAALPASPAYFFFTYLGFLVLQPSDAVARLAPALAGAGLVLLPWFFRPALGRGAALATSGLLAVSGGLVAASRSADGTMITLAAFGLALGLFQVHLAGGSVWLLIGAAVALGVAAAGGGTFLTGVLLVGLLVAVAARTQVVEQLAWRAALAALRAERVTLLVAFGLAALLVATTGLQYRFGLGALGNSWLNWLTGFAITAQGRSLLVIPVFLLAYEPFLLVFGLIGAVRAFRRGEAAGQALAGLALIGLMFALFYSGRTLFDVVWLSLPLAALAAQALAAILPANLAREEWPQTAALTGLLTMLLAFAGLNLTRFVDQFGAGPAAVPLDLANAPGLWLAGLTLVVGGLVTYLFGVTWSPRSAVAGLTLSVAGALLAGGLSAAWGLTQLRAAEPVELWWTRPAAMDLRRLVQTLTTVSNFDVGQEREIVVTVQADPDSALAWALRDFPKAEFVDDLGAFITSPVVIAPVTQQNPALGSAYVGQAFAVARFWRPENLFWNEQLTWLAARRGLAETESVVLWVRQDIQQLQSVQQP
jgi:hypothetical protein